MTKSFQSPDDQLAYRLAIVLPHTKEILAESDGSALQLPTITIQGWNRPAEQITTTIRCRWNLQSIVVDSIVPSDDAPGLAVLEARSYGDSTRGTSLRPYHPGLICLDTRSRNLLQEILTGSSEDRSPLLRLGWIDEAQRWIQSNVRDRKIQFNGDLRQLNAGSGFALIRLSVSDGPAYWVKAAGPPNSREVAITETLSECSPASLPTLVAVHRTWNAWAMEEAGSALNDSVDAETISVVSLGLARLQQQTINHGKEFLNCGCGDQRTETLLGCLPEFLNAVAKLVPDITLKDSGPEIITIVPRIEHTLILALEGMGQLRIPDTINNNDIKLANILFDGSRCAFIDWCHSYWGNPFLTFQHLHIYLSRRLPGLARPCKESYALAWTGYLSEDQIVGAMDVAPIVAPYAYLCGWGPASLVSRIADPSMKKIFLNLVRRILSAGEQLSRKERRAYA